MSAALVPTAPGPLGASPRRLADHLPAFLGWLQFVRGRSPHTLAAYRRDLEAFLAFLGEHGLEQADQVTHRVVEGYLAWRLHRLGRKPASVNRARHALKTFWRWLRREGYATGDPAGDTYPFRELKRLPRYLPIPEQERLLAALAEDRSLDGRRDYALIATALLTGLRVSELASLRVDDVDLESGRLRVIGKGDKEREVPIIPRLAAILREYLTEVRPRLVERPIRGRLRRSPRGRRWLVEYRLGGVRRSFTTGTTDRAEAERIMAERLADLRFRQLSPYLFVRAGQAGGYCQKRGTEPLLTRSLFRAIRRR
ncbi:MAG TPA: site-specific integrase, partial [Dehalococcoidia bacterium]|nr:site-specific integrase [Dehalococcoidia bacterium]